MRRLDDLESNSDETNSDETNSDETNSETNDKVLEIIRNKMATDPKKDNPYNKLAMSRRDTLLKDLIDNENLRVEFNNFAITTVIGPYGDHHVMVIYIGERLDVSDISKLTDTEREELFEILDILAKKIKEEYKDELNGEGEEHLDLLMGVNHSYEAGSRLAAQSLKRVHWQVCLLGKTPKTSNTHDITILPLVIEGDKSNKHLLSFNSVNLSMIKEFEKFSGVVLGGTINKKSGLIITEDEYYGLDFELPGGLGNSETQEIIKKVNNEGGEFLKSIVMGSNSIPKSLFEEFKKIRQEEIKKLNIDIKLSEILNRVSFTLGVFEHNGKWHLRIRFSFKEIGQDSGVVETGNGKSLHSIFRDPDKGKILPDQTRIVNTVLNIDFPEYLKAKKHTY